MTPNHPRTLYITDLDGTLLADDSRLSPRTVRALNLLASRGVMITPCTARTPATVQPLFEGVIQPEYTDAGGTVRPLPAIVMTGAGLWNRSSVEFERIKLIAEEDAIAIRDEFLKQGLHPFVYTLSGNSFLNVYHTEGLTSRENAFYQERRHLELKRFHIGQQPAAWNRVAVFFAIGPTAKVAATAEALREATGCAAAWYPDIFLPETGLIDLYAPGVSKAAAVESLAREVRADRIVVFGDNLNDLPMMRVADHAVAVENALDQVKAQADEVIGSNRTDAVVRYIAGQEGIDTAEFDFSEED